MAFYRQEYQSELTFPPSGDLPNPGIKPVSLVSTALQVPHGSDGKESACQAKDLGLISGSGRSLGEGNGNPLQYSCLENSMDRGAWKGFSAWGHKESDMTERMHDRANTRPSECMTERIHDRSNT